jgi:hypothetical protein
MTNYSLTKDNRILRDGAPTGYSIGRGAYVGTSDDKIGRWYVERDDGPVDRRGRGYRSRKAAFDAFVADDLMLVE